MKRMKTLPQLLQPDLNVTSFRQLDPHALADQGIRLLICDIDNTLVAYDDPDANRDVEAFLHTAKSAGLHTVLMSNNFPWRVERFARDLGLEKVYAFSMKPMPFSYRKACRDFGLEPQQAAILGDQLFTDTLGGNLAGVTTILSHPLVEKERADTKLLRFFERLAGRDLPRGRTRQAHSARRAAAEWKPMGTEADSGSTTERDQTDPDRCA